MAIVEKPPKESKVLSDPFLISLVTFAMNYLSRFAIMSEMRQAVEAGSGRMISVLSAGNGKKVDSEDWQLKSTSSALVPFFIRALNQHATLNDVMVGEFAKRYSNNGAQYFHYFPGIVNTQGVRNNNFPWLVTVASDLFMPLIAVPPSTPAKTIVDILTKPGYGDRAKNGGLLAPNGSFLKPSIHATVAGLGDALWNYTTELVENL